MNVLPEIDGLIDRKFILNIKVEGSFASYATVAKRLLIDDKAKQIQLSACGAAVLYLFKVSSVLTEYFPSLHTITFISYTRCHSCKARQLKQKMLSDLTGETSTNSEVDNTNDENLKSLGQKESPDKIQLMQDYLDKFNEFSFSNTHPSSSDNCFTDKQQQKSHNVSSSFSLNNSYSIAHYCHDSSTFPCLITVNQRLSFQDSLWDKSHSGYQKPKISPNSKFSFNQLIQMYNPHERLD